MLTHHVIAFEGGSERELGLDRYDPARSVVCPAFKVLARLEKPKGDPEEFVTKHALKRYEEALIDLTELREVMVIVEPFGVVVGEYSVRPFLIGPKEYATLCRYMGVVIHA